MYSKINKSFIEFYFIESLVDTSRSPRPGEVNGKEYNFVSRELMEEQIARGEFLEFGEYKGNLYGTSLESVKSIIRSGLTCIINPHYQVE